MNKLEYLIEINKQGVQFIIEIPHPGGVLHCDATPEQVLEYEESPTRYYATARGVSVPEYLRWCEAEYCVQCAADTKSGERCKNIVRGGYDVEPREWLAMQGEYCPIHGEGNVP